MDFLRYLGPILFLAGAVVFWKSSRRLWSAVDTPTLVTGHVTIGQIEVCGKADAAPGKALVNSPLSAKTCVWFKAEVQQETGGKNKSWKTRHTSTSSPWLVVDDDSGPVLVNLAGVSPASLDSTTIGARDLPAFLAAHDLDVTAAGGQYLPNPNRVGTGGIVQRLMEEVTQTFRPDQPIAELGGKWRVLESRIELGSQLYVIGSTRFDEGEHSVRFEKQKGRPLFVYNGSQKDLVRNSRRFVIAATAAIVLGTFLAGASWKALGVDPQRRLNVGAGLFLLAPLVCLGLCVQMVRIRNRIAATANQVQAGQGLVDIALAKRATLIPNLVGVVQAATAHTEEVVAHLTRLRAERSSGAKELAELNVVSQRYPTLGTSANFLHLQQSLSAVETDLAVASGFVADAQAVHRTRIQSFPDSMVAKMFGLDSLADAQAIPASASEVSNG